MPPAIYACAYTILDELLASILYNIRRIIQTQMQDNFVLGLCKICNCGPVKKEKY